MAPTAKHAPVLKLRDKEPTRPFLELAGERYHYALRSDLSVTELLEAKAAGEQFQNVTEVTAENVDALVTGLRRAVAIVMYDMPDAVLDSLTDGECMAILEGFAQAQEAAATPAQSGTSPLASAASTASRRVST